MESFGDVWKEVDKRCRETMADAAYKLWIAIITPVELSAKEAVLHVPSSFQRKIILENYIPVLADHLNDLLGFPVTIRILTDEDKPKVGATFQSPPYIGSEYEYTFETYIVGASNRFVHAASVAVAENPSKIYNPLFIYGNSGLGKTHLLHAISHRIRQMYPELRQLYVRAEDFTNDMLAALQQGQQGMIEFREKYRSVDVFLVDDVQFIAGKNITEEEFFNTFNALYNDRKQMVVTSDRPPKEIQSLEQRIRSRFEQGLIADIQPPEFETRVGIIQRKAEMLNIQIPEDVVFFIANQLKSNIRQLEGVVKKLQAYIILQNSEPTIAVAQNAIRDIRNDDQPEPVTVSRIISEVSRTYAVDAEDIRSKKRDAPISKARQVAIYIVREITGMPVSSIGEEFGGRDHSTIVYAIEQVKRLMAKNPREKATIEDIIKNIQDN